MKLPRPRRAPAPPAIMPPPVAVPATAPARSRTGNLFVIGAARSGTTVLQNALNDAPEIFLFGEPNFHHDHGPGFAARYNARHREWKNQETKSTFCPPILDEDGGWRDYVARLAETHRWVGSKIVINPRHRDQWVEEMFVFHCRHFYDAAHIFTFRDPQAVICSTRNLQSYVGAELEAMRGLMANYAETVACFTRMLRILPNVRALFLEDAGPPAFEELGQWLGTDLSHAAAYYEASRVRRYDIGELGEDEAHKLGLLDTLYADLRAEAARGFPRPQLEQNDENIDPAHYTPLGSINRRARMIADTLRKPAN
jgi:hypothetical protein